MSDDLNADVVIVGAGVAGGIAAHALASAGVKVVMLEAGPRLDRGEIVERFRNVVKKDFMAPYPFAAHAPHPMVTNDTYLIQKGPQPYDTQYIRAVGGTTWHWAAAA
jgi:glucose dehydrogenase